MNSIVEAQQNFNELLDNTNISVNYCPLLKDIVNKTVGKVNIAGLIGFFLPRKAKGIIVGKEITPTAFVHTANDGLNSFWVRSYDCVFNQNSTLGDRCLDCIKLNRTFRNKAPEEAVRNREVNKIKKNCNTKINKSENLYLALKEKMK